MKKTLLLSIIVLFFCIGAASFGENPLVVMETNYGDITLELYPDEAPITVDNFLSYVNDGFYNSTVFHRVIRDFMIQAGGYYVEDNTIYPKPPTYGPIINESINGLSNLRGTLAMARTVEPDSATSQFYINHVDNLHLDYGTDIYGWCVFGKVVDGMNVVDAIAQVETLYLDPSLANFPYDSNMGTVDIISVYEIPEPATLSLLALGGLLMRKRK
jgi:cyclophilin family peptidyl-prolyl cis-trans isomerase